MMKSKKNLILSLTCVLFLLFAAGGTAVIRGEANSDTDSDLLFQKLTSIMSSQRKEALAFIEKKKPVALLPRLAKAITDTDDYEKRAVYTKAMKMYGSENTMLYWFDILKETGSFPLKIEIMKHVASFGDRRIVLPVARQLDSRFSAVRKTAREILRKNGDDRIYPLILLMAGDKNPVKRIYALEAMQSLYDRRFYKMITDMTGDPVKSVRIYALRCIEKNNLRQAVFLVRRAALQDTDREVRIEAVQIIGRMNDTSSNFVLVKSLSSGDRDIRCAAVQSLYKTGYAGAAFSLSSQLAREKDREIKYLILETMLKIRNVGHVKAVQKVLVSDPHFRLRILAAQVLGQVTRNYHLSILLGALGDKDYRVRAEIAHSLGNYRSSRSITGLLNIVRNDSSRYVRSAALYALFRINDKDTLLPLYDRFSRERNVIFREQLRIIVRKMIDRHV